MMDALHEKVEALLDEVIDPCSAGMGIPAGLVSMGLIKQLEIYDLATGGKRVDILLRLTSPCCMMAPHFAAQTKAKLAEIDEISQVEIDVCPQIDWEPSHMSESFRAKLARPDFMKPF